ncbi:DUF4167 domain-containing protein [Paracoccus aminophilus]|uniref:DUF4167 domain-containing protein n=1 Tax=Paracoccus aminophilus JCM 7686 TaxID=1367847 RepID=S5Y909_PARAH|nr:DUF4167 domain-containing protein [Paracoccus aminophilus]AGT07838.1 hypothetical protein JCM7686_0729 [Paracoccus aminophilus JCM 7686]
MRSSKSRSRNKSNRQRTLGNIVNRVFDSSGPEGKVRGTPQQIIEKYLTLARDAQLSNDRVAEQSFLQHAEHYTRLLGEAQREMAERQQQYSGQRDDDNREDGNEGAGQGGNGRPYRDDQPRDDRNRDNRARDDRARDDRSRDDRPRDERARDDRPREDRPREDRARESREDRPRDEQRPREDRRQPREVVVAQAPVTPEVTALEEAQSVVAHSVVAEAAEDAGLPLAIGSESGPVETPETVAEVKEDERPAQRRRAPRAPAAPRTTAPRAAAPRSRKKAEPAAETSQEEVGEGNGQ